MTYRPMHMGNNVDDDRTGREGKGRASVCREGWKSKQKEKRVLCQDVRILNTTTTTTTSTNGARFFFLFMCLPCLYAKS